MRRLLVAVCIGAAAVVMSAQYSTVGREVVVTLRAVDKDGRPVSDLSKEDVHVVDEGIERTLTSFDADVFHAQVVVLVDVSGSMTPVLERLRSALSAFADLMGADGKHDVGGILLTLIPFSDSVVPLVYRTPNPEDFKHAVPQLRAGSSTALVDAMLATLYNAFPNRSASTSLSPEPRNRAARDAAAAAGDDPAGVLRSRFLVVFTDAGENASEHKWSEIGSAVLGREVNIYAVAFTTGAPDSDFQKLAQVTSQSGGRLYQSNGNDLARIASDIARNIRTHYQLSFSANDVVDTGRWRTIAITSTRPGVTIFARTGYCPVAPCQNVEGTDIGGRITFQEAQRLSLNSDGRALRTALRQRLTALRFGYSDDLKKLAPDLTRDRLLVEKVWNLDDAGRTQPRYTTSWASKRGNQVGIDAEVCGINGEAVQNWPHPNVQTDLAPPATRERILAVEDVRFDVTPGPGQIASNAGDNPDFQSQLQFNLRDLSAAIPQRIKVHCIRPNFLLGDGIVQLGMEAVQRGLKADVLKRVDDK